MNALQTTLKQLRLSGLIQTLDVRPQEAAANRLATPSSSNSSVRTNSTSASNVTFLRFYEGGFRV